MKNLITLIFCLALAGPHAAAEETPQCLNARIVLLVDWSNSVEGTERFLCLATNTLAERFESSNRDVRMALVRFGSIARTDVPMEGSPVSVKDASATLCSMQADGGGTNLLSGLAVAAEELGLRHRGQTLAVPDDGRENIIIVISDGEAYEPDLVSMKASALKEAGVRIFTVFVSKTPPDDDGPCDRPERGESLLQKIASPEGYVRTDIGSLIRTVEDISVCL